MKKSFTAIIILIFAGLPALRAQDYTYIKRPGKPLITYTESSPPSENENGLPAKTISLSNGVKLEYVEQGDPKGIAVVLLHGLTDSRHSYDLVLPHLPSSYHVFSITQRGHGNSDKPKAGYTPADFAADLALFLDKVKVKKAVIVGHSMGGIIAQQFAVKYPDYVAGVALVSTFARFSDKPDMIEFQKNIHQLTDPIDPAFAKEFQQSTIKKEVPADFFDAAVQESLKVPARVWTGIIDGFMSFDFTKELLQVQKPAVIFWGDQDLYCPLDDQKKLLASIPGSVLVTYTGIGHALHWEEPARFATDLVNFVKSIK